MSVHIKTIEVKQMNVETEDEETDVYFRINDTWFRSTTHSGENLCKVADHTAEILKALEDAY